MRFCVFLALLSCLILLTCPCFTSSCLIYVSVFYIALCVLYFLNAFYVLSKVLEIITSTFFDIKTVSTAS